MANWTARPAIRSTPKGFNNYSMTPRTKIALFVIAAIAIPPLWVFATQERPNHSASATKPSASRPAKPEPGPAKSAGSQPSKKLDRAELEKQLEASLENVTLDGIYQMVVGDGPLSEPKPDKYMIESAHKTADDWWVFKARILYEHHDVTLPVRVRIVWAEDTPVVTVDDVAIPGIGTYSARVMFYRGYYSGTWFGKGYGGIMSGRIIKTLEKPESEK